MKKYIMNEHWEMEEFEDDSNLYLLVIEQHIPACSYIHQTDLDPDSLLPGYTQLIQQYEDTAVDGLLQISLVKVPNTEQICSQLGCCDSMEKGSTSEAIDAINNILNRADCEILENWHKDVFTEARRTKRKKKQKPCDSITYSTGYPELDVEFFNSHFGSSGEAIGNETVSETGAQTGAAEGGSNLSENLTEADDTVQKQGERGRQPGKRYIKRYYIRPQNIFCSKKSDILAALVKDVGDANCSVYSLKSLEDHDDVHLLKPSDIIYYYDDGILYDKNHVKVMDYDLNVKHEEERTKFANIDAVSDVKFEAEYKDRLIEKVENVCCICKEPFEGHGNNPSPLQEKGRCCNACNLKFVVPARIELYFRDSQTES